MDNEQTKKMENNPSSSPEKDASQQTDNGSVSSTDTAAPQKPGAILAARRIAAGISEEQIASRLKMSVRQVRYIEADDYDALHGMATARGFVRAYARLLQVDPEPLVALFAEKKKVPSSVNATPGKGPEPFSKNREPFRKKRGSSGKIAILLIIVLGVLVVAANMKFFSFMNTFKKETPEAVAPKAEPATPPAAPATETKEVSPINDQAQNAENKPADQAAGTVAGTTSPNASAPVQATNAQAASATAVQTPAAKGSPLVISFREKSWLQIQKKDGTVMAEYIGKPGEKRQLDVTEPVTVIVGFAPGVNMEFKGAPVDLVSNTTNSVAKVTLK